MLIVIAIIGILVSILLPSLSKAREKAYIAVCMSNLSQIGKAAHMHVRDNDGKYPQMRYSRVQSWLGKTGTASPFNGKLRAEKRDLNKYLGITADAGDIAVCPSGVNGIDRGTDYAGNISGFTTTLNSIEYLTKVTDPTRMLQSYEYGAYRVTKKSMSSVGYENYHKFKRYNVNFVDGHCRSTLEFRSNLKSSPDFTFDNNN